MAHARARKLGPYFRLAYRADGRQQSIYIGACTKLVARVRALLADLQAVIRRHRAYRITRRELRTALRRRKAECDAVLRAHGLTPRGYDVRGFRRASSSVEWPQVRSTRLPQTPSQPLFKRMASRRHVPLGKVAQH